MRRFRLKPILTAFSQSNRTAEKGGNDLKHVNWRFLVGDSLRKASAFLSCNNVSYAAGSVCCRACGGGFTSFSPSFTLQTTTTGWPCCQGLTLQYMAKFLSGFSEQCGDTIGVCFVAFVAVEQEVPSELNAVTEPGSEGDTSVLSRGEGIPIPLPKAGKRILLGVRRLR